MHWSRLIVCFTLLFLELQHGACEGRDRDNMFGGKFWEKCIKALSSKLREKADQFYNFFSIFK